jgi:hypothetical protein
MLGKRKILKVSAAVVAIATMLFVVACGSSTPKKSWEQQFNDEVSFMDINLGPAQESPAFEFSLNEQPPHFSMILCKGASDDSRTQEDAWNTFFNEVRKYGPAESYKPDFSEAGEENGKPITRVMMFVNLKAGADASVAQDVAHKMVNVMKEFSPCK